MSNSIILNNILKKESCELKQSIDKFMDESFDKLQIIMKSKIEKIISEKLNSFYNVQIDEREKILFDESKNDIRDNKTKDKLLNEKCFTLEYSNFPNGQCRMYYYKNILIVKNFLRNSPDEEYIYNHTFTIPMLFAIKYCNPIRFHNYNTIQLLDHPEYFQSINSSNFEEICKNEYENIKKIKEKLNNKKEYYETLEKKLIKEKLKVSKYKKKYYESYEEIFKLKKILYEKYESDSDNTYDKKYDTNSDNTSDEKYEFDSDNILKEKENLDSVITSSPTFILDGGFDLLS